MWRTHRSAPIFMIVVLGGLAACGAETRSTTTGSGACAGGATILSDETVAPGQSVVATAEDMWSGCVDHIVVRVGEAAGESRTEMPDVRPLTDQPVRWRQGSEESVMDTADADSDGVIELPLTIPADAQSGTAEIQVATASPATVTVEARY